MAMALKRQYDLTVLKTELVDAPREESRVRFTLEGKVQGELKSLATWTTPTKSLGLSERFDARASLRQGPTAQLPSELLQGLGGFLNEDAESDRTLWVHLVKPYGVLRFVQWEKLLGAALGVPILMLPDFIFPPPRETRGTLEVVLCGSAPHGHEEGSVLHHLRQAVDRILEASVRRTRIHVFVDKDLAPPLRSHWAASGQLDNSVLLHAHAIAARYVAEDLPSRLLDRTDSIRSPWLLWMREALRGRSVDVLHFICHGYLSRERGALLFAQSPLERTDRYLSGPVSAAELQCFLNQVGAWSTVFSSLPDNYSEPGLRALADEIAQGRPGPLMMHNLGEDPRAEHLAPAYRFLYAPERTPIPVSRSLFIYCQPYRVTEAVQPRRTRGAAVRTTRSSRAFVDAGTGVARNSQQQKAVACANEESPLDALFDQSDNVSSLVASTERFAEQVQLRYQQLARDELLPLDQGERAMKLAEGTIAKLRQAVAEVAKSDPIEAVK